MSSLHWRGVESDSLRQKLPRLRPPPTSSPWPSMPIVLAYEEPVPSSTPAHAIMPPPSAVPLAFDAVAQLPAPLDNAAIAKEDLEAGQLISHASTSIRLSARVLEGHRFAVAPIGLGELITSWGEPFGKALRPIAPGEWLRNTKVIAALLPRGLEPGFTRAFGLGELRPITDGADDA